MGNEPAGLLASVRAASAEVTDLARLVTIDENALERFARELPRIRAHSEPPDYFFVNGTDDTVAYIVTYNAINFGSGWHPYVRKLPGLSGSMTMMAMLTRRFRKLGPI